MKTLNFPIVATVLSTCLVSSCGGGSQSDSKTCPDLAGTWTVVSIDDNTKCGGSLSTASRQAVVEQNGCSFTMTSTREVVTGTGSGNQLSGTSKSTDSNGTSTGTFSGKASADGKTVTGEDSWTYKSDSTTCEGTSQLTATRLTSSSSGSTQVPDTGEQGGANSSTSSIGNGGTTSSNTNLGSGGTSNANTSQPSGGTTSSTSGTGLCSLEGFYPATQAKHVVASGSYAYVAEGTSGIEILDISNPATPKAIGALPTTNATRLVLNGSTLYVADGTGGLKVVDVSTPTNPKLVSTPTLLGSGPAEIRSLALNGTRLYGGFMNLNVFDVTNPAAPVAKGALSTTFLEDLAVNDTLVFAATASGIEVFSALSPTPFLAGANKNNDWGSAIALSAGYAFYGGSNGLSVFDISNPAAPTLAASSGLVTSIKGLSAKGNYLYVSAQGPGLTVFDISNAKAPKVAGKCGETSVGSPESMTISGQHAYVAGGTGGVVILKLLSSEQGNSGTGGAGGTSAVSTTSATGAAGSASACNLIGFYPAAKANHVIASGSRAYVAEGAAGIEVLDISNPAQPTPIGALPTTGATRLAINGNSLYVADGDGGLKVIDVTNPANPQLVATPSLLSNGPGTIQSIALGGTTLYAAYIGLNVLDATAPASPVAKGSLSSTFIQDMAVDGTLVYAASADGLEVYSALAQSNPFLAGSYATTDWGYAIAVSSGYAYYGSRSGLTVFDVSTPSTPTVAASSGALGTINGLTVHGDYLYVSGPGPGLNVLNISNPKLPKAAGKCGELSVGTPLSMTTADKYGYVAAGTGGVVILELML